MSDPADIEGTPEWSARTSKGIVPAAGLDRSQTQRERIGRAHRDFIGLVSAAMQCLAETTDEILNENPTGDGPQAG